MPIVTTMVSVFATITGQELIARSMLGSAGIPVLAVQAHPHSTVRPVYQMPLMSEEAVPVMLTGATLTVAATSLTATLCVTAAMETVHSTVLSASEMRLVMPQAPVCAMLAGLPITAQSSLERAQPPALGTAVLPDQPFAIAALQTRTAMTTLSAYVMRGGLELTARSMPDDATHDV